MCRLKRSRFGRKSERLQAGAVAVPSSGSCVGTPMADDSDELVHVLARVTSLDSQHTSGSLV